MKIFCIYRHKVSAEKEEIKKITAKLKEKGNEISEFNLFDAKTDADYDNLVDSIWEADKTISWW